MQDKRKEILNNQKYGFDSDQYASALNAMDEYMRERCLELLQYVAENKMIACMDEDGAFFLTRGESLTKEQVFENFI